VVSSMQLPSLMHIEGLTGSVWCCNLTETENRAVVQIWQESSIASGGETTESVRALIQRGTSWYASHDRCGERDARSTLV